MGNQPQEAPNAYLNYLLYDEDYQLVDQGFQKVSEAAAVGKANPDASAETLALEVPIEEEGFLYAYLSNEPNGLGGVGVANSGTPVYFDDFTIEQQSYIVQVDDYYIFGMTHRQPLPNQLKNRYLYNGKEMTSDFELNVYDYIARNYDPALGRFWQVDPLADQMSRFSPYAYAFDNPVRFIDPDGMMPSDPICPECPGSEAEQVANVVAATISDGLAGLYNLAIGRFNNTVADNSADGITIQIKERQDPTTLLEAVTGPVVDALNASAIVTGGNSSTGALVAKTGVGAGLKNTAADVVEGIDKATDLATVKKGSDEWNAVVSDISNLEKGKTNVRVETATDAKSLLKESRGDMNRYKNYSKDKGVTYRKGYETHNSQNPREVGAGNDLQHIKWKDGKAGGHIFYNKPN